MNPDVVFVKNKIADYMNLIFHNSSSFPPPGPNAANGFFQQSFSSLGRFADAPERRLTNDNAKQLYVLFQNIAFHTNTSFTQFDLHRASGVEVFKNNKDAIIASALIIKDLFILINGSDEEKKKSLRDLKKNINDLVTAMGNKHIKSGRHGNGAITTEIRNRHLAFQEETNNGILKDAKEPDVVRIKKMLNVYYNNVLSLDTAAEPWLPGNWQLQFSIYCLQLGKALEILK